MTESKTAETKTTPESQNGTVKQLVEPSPRAVQTVESSQDFLAQVVGNESREGERIQAGPILKLMYDTAAAVSIRHSGHRTVMLRLDRLDMTGLICHMDLVRLEGRVIEAGRSSMVVEVRCMTKRPMERDFIPCHVGYLTMVAINDQGQPTRSMPPFSYDSPLGKEARMLAAHRRSQLDERKQSMAWIEQEHNLRVQDVMEREPFARYDYLSPEESEVHVKGQLLPSGLYQDRRVLAGDLLVWLERIATYTARHFTRNTHVVTISLDEIEFNRALHATDRIELRSRVVYVRTHTLQVTIDITVHTMDGQRYNLDPVNFIILNYQPNGTKKRIHTGLRLTDNDQVSLKRYLKARTKHSFWKSNPESHLILSF
ncbi:MAG: acyl-CoA thioesterase [Deltaproteobacteria bacterium]|nr:acyl-CoA thioesterase [Deltaproteobacteria bacterium]